MIDAVEHLRNLERRASGVSDLDNLSETATIGHARPSVAPSIASLHFNKTECFCFVEQEFAPGEARDMPVRFVLSRDLPADIATVTLSYTFFNSRQTG